MKKLGIVVGKFAPLTLGHINLINIAATECEAVLVVLSHDQRWVDSLSPRDQVLLSLNNRRRWLDQTFADTPHVMIDTIDESDIPAFPNGWYEYCDLLADVISNYDGSCEEWGQLIHPEDIAIFSSEPGYTEHYREHLGIENIVVDHDRTNVPISATMIRENLYDNWGFLPTVVRRDYAKRVLVMGQESTGKTSLVKALAKQFATSWVEEYGRTYCETVLGGSEVTLRSEDYPIIAYRHKVLELEAQAHANRLVFIDTGAFSTEYFHRLYEGVPNPVVSAIAANEHYDLVIILSPNVPWVADGLRLNDDRSKTTPLWGDMLVEFPNQTPPGRTVYISADNYRDRFDQALSAVRNYLNDVNKGLL